VVPDDAIEIRRATGAVKQLTTFLRQLPRSEALGFFEPDGIVMHPTQYKLLRLARDENNQYFGGGYFMNQYGNGAFQAMPSVWGLNTVITTAIDEDLILVGAFKLGAQIFDRMGLRVDTTTTDSDDWSNNRIAVRVEERLTLAVYRPPAFCKVHDIPTGGS
jgi:HK97 family phage major capsid protein